MDSDLQCAKSNKLKCLKQILKNEKNAPIFINKIMKMVEIYGY